MKAAVMLAALIVLGGCSVLGTGMDAANNRMVKELTAYCSQPLYRREALYILVNGAVADQHIQIGVICPGDEVEE